MSQFLMVEHAAVPKLKAVKSTLGREAEVEATGAMLGKVLAFVRK